MVGDVSLTLWSLHSTTPLAFAPSAEWSLLMTLKTATKIFLGLAVGAGALMWSGTVPHPSGAFVSTADARVGAPRSPRSVAGVARRNTRRNVAAGTALGIGVARTTTRRAAVVGAGAAVGGAAATRPCARVMGPQGRTVTVCR
jgi:hypothetical protein